jgi:uncharacterized protein YwqG
MEWWECRTREDVEVMMRTDMPAYANDVLPFGLPAIRFEAEDLTCSRPALRLGGGAELAPELRWPHRDGLPMHMLAVVDCELVAGHDLSGILPTTGRLYFFADLVDGLYRGNSPGVVMHVVEPLGAFRTRYREAVAADERLGLSSTIRERRYRSAYAQWTLPDVFETCIGDLWTQPERDPDRDSFADFADFINLADEQMLGWPNLRQNAMQQQCERGSTGLGERNDVDVDVSDDSVQQWRLLLQYGYDGDQSIAAFDLGTLYFWIRESDLLERNFDNVWTIAQFE